MVAFLRAIFITSPFLCAIVVANAQKASTSALVARLTRIDPPARSELMMPRLVRASLLAASLKGEPWDSIATQFKDKTRFPSPQAPGLVALVSPEFSADAGVTFDYWLVAHRFKDAVYLTKASFRALELYQLPENIIRAGVGGITARVLALPPVRKSAHEFPMVKSIVFDCRPIGANGNVSQTFVLESVITLCRKRGEETSEGLHFGAEVVRQKKEDGKWEIALVKADRPRAYVRESDGREVFYGLGSVSIK